MNIVKSGMLAAAFLAMPLSPLPSVNPILTATMAHADEMRSETVRFPAGSTGTIIRDTVSGRDSVLYRIGASAGQQMTIALDSDNSATYFNVLAPGRVPGDEALAVGSQTGDYMPDLNRFSGVLPESGDYSILVYLFRNAARRGETSNYQLSIDISAAGGDYADGLQGGPDFWEVTQVPAGDTLNLRASPSTSSEVLSRLANGVILRNGGCRMEGGQRWCKVETIDGSGIGGWVSGRYLMESSYTDNGGSGDSQEGNFQNGNSAERAGRGDFDATGIAPCAQESGQPMTQCDYGVARDGGGNATVVITRPDGRTRAIFFENGRAISADTSQADGYGEFSVTRESDLNLIRVGEERYEIPDAAIFGG